MFKPKIIEKDLSCLQHSQPIESVILNGSMKPNQRLLCKICDNIPPSNLTIVDYEQLKLFFEQQQMETINKYASIMTPHINIVKSLKDTITSLRTSVIRFLDDLLGLSDDWITAIIESITSYSFFQQLDNYTSNKNTLIDSNQLINKTRKIHQDLKTKIHLKLVTFKHFSQFKTCQTLICDLDRLTNNQEDELKSHSRSQPDEVLIFENYIHKMFPNLNQYSSQKKRVQIQKTEKHIIYTSNNREVIRSDQVSQQPILLEKWEQILNLQWKGQFGRDGQKIGNWIATWKDEIISGVGGQYIDGNKQGLWVDIIPNYWSKARAVEIGKYNANKRIDNWSYYYREKKFGGGNYNQFGVKIGEWIELWEGFWDQSQVTQNGRYETNNRRSTKVGRWDIMYCKRGEQEYKQMNTDIYLYSGGGSYDQEGNQKKIGKWVELFEGFRDVAQVTFNGNYNRRGMKVGRWDIMYCKLGEEVYKQIGGGSYDQEGNQKKIGKWVELDEGFCLSREITQNGHYNKNGMKVSLWDIVYGSGYQKKSKSIGGGSYDQEGSQKKIGKWVELVEGFWDVAQVIFNGDYNMNGMKVGRWDIMYCKLGEEVYKQIGGGSYDQGGNQEKIGKWIELDEKFSHDEKITFNGEYNMIGMKVGRWDIMYCKRGEQEYKQMNTDIYLYSGGGSYDQEGNQKKIGKWIELNEKFEYNMKVLQCGEYNKNGVKVGSWNILYDDSDYKLKRSQMQNNHELPFVGGQYYNNITDQLNNQCMCKNQFGSYQKIGGGSYDENENQTKIGEWEELHEQFSHHQKITFKGEYNMDGMKIGRWDILYCKLGEEVFKQIGGGQYDQDGNQKKIGEWEELHEQFSHHEKITFKGKYNMGGMKVGKWGIMVVFEKSSLIGGGQYNPIQNQKKIGMWREVFAGFDFGAQVTFQGEYNAIGMKVGRWDILYCKMGGEVYKQIGGGSYDQEGNQIAEWVELDENFSNSNQLTYAGKYNQNGMKVGRWNIMFSDGHKEYQQVGGGDYDQDGNQRKFGIWVEMFKGFGLYSEAIYKGKYNMNGMKVGRWDFLYKDRKIGGGDYDQDGNQRKFGKWVELVEGFNQNFQGTYVGEYNMKGQKVGIWVEQVSGQILREIRYDQ